jgi:hypothetical protein
MRPLHESGPARTAVSTIVREAGHVKGENIRIARKVYRVIRAAPLSSSTDDESVGEAAIPWVGCRGIRRVGCPCKSSLL